jgi:hypothetical protein
MLEWDGIHPAIRTHPLSETEGKHVVAAFLVTLPPFHKCPIRTMGGPYM